MMLSLLALATLVAAQAGPTVNLGYATYQGTFNATANLSTFLGIRFAASPAGEKRWTAPAPPAKVTGIQQATTFPNQCMQCFPGTALTNPFTSSHSKRQTAIQSSEDCLFLDVFVPGQIDPKKKLPVLVWIHGGGYQAGNGAFPSQDLVQGADGELIAVSIQYRLGVFGFLPGKAVKDGGVLNAGLLDQQFALKWVQDNIAKFGGDPSQVTIWGESAGAGSVLQHVIANGGKTSPPLFKRAMTSSTFLPSQYVFDDQIPEELFSMTLTQTGCKDLACLRSTPVNTLQAANTNISTHDFSGLWAWVPVVDGTLIRSSPIKSILAKQVNGEALLSVTNTFEGRAFVNNVTATQALGLTSYVTNAFPNLNSLQVQSIVNTYEQTGGSVDDQAIGVQGESIFICPTYYLLKAFGSNAYKGEFAIPQGNHGDDVGYYFFPDGGRSATFFNNMPFIDAFRKSFFSTAIFGNPNIKLDANDTKPFWSSWSDGSREMLFNVTADGSSPVIHTFETDAGLLERCGLWASLAGSTKQ